MPVVESCHGIRRADQGTYQAAGSHQGVMTNEIALLLFILAVSLVLFSFEWVSIDIVGLGVLIALVISGLLPADQAFAGFGSDTVILIFGLLVMTATLSRTGVVEIVGRAISRHARQDHNRLLAIVMIASASMSSIMSNTATTAFFVPIVMGLARRLRVNASRLLMPLAFASILASSVTLIATSTNILVSGLLTQYRMPPIGMFELAPVGIPIVLIGLVYMFTLGRRLIPDRGSPDELTEEFGLRPYLTDVVILPDSPLIGKTLAQSGLGRDMDLTVLRVDRGRRHYFAPQTNIRLREGDVLLVEGQRDNILNISNAAGIDIKAEVKFSDPDLQTDDMRLAEVIVMGRSPVIGRSLESTSFRERYGLQVLAINRQQETIRQKISQVNLRMGDVLLVQGHRSNIQALEKNFTFRILGMVEDKRINFHRARLAIIIFLVSLGLAAFNLLTLPVAVLLGAVSAFLTRCITPQEAYRDVEWKVIIMIGCMLAFGAAMEHTGTARYLALQIVRLVGDTHPTWLLSGFFVLTVLLTQPMSNQAAAVVVFPVAVQAAMHLNLNPRTFAMMIAVAASTSYITPLEPACLMVYGLGRYRFLDFVKVGSLLTVFIYLVAILLVPRIWPL